ncbi:MAG: hypothetical protein ACOY41_09760 [Pseudomonadota bacterium]
MNAWLLQQKKQHPKSLLRTLLGERVAKCLALELQALHWSAQAETSLAEIPDAVLADKAAT